MKVILDPMDEEAFLAYREDNTRGLAQERVRYDGLSPEDALAHARKQGEALLPLGKATPGHNFYHLKVGETPVGRLWLWVDPVERRAWLYHIEIFPEHRRQGYGRGALDAAFEQARNLGARQIWLNVFAHNEGAQALYRQSGMELASLHMKRDL